MRLRRVKAVKGLMLPRAVIYAEALARLKRRKGGRKDALKKRE